MVNRKRNPKAIGKRREEEPLDTLVADDILAPNSDAECEPLAKRCKHIERITQHCRDGGELRLISTTLRGPVTRNPWARTMTSAVHNTKGNKRLKARKIRQGKPSRSVIPVSATKDTKVDQYFPARKNSRERDIAEKTKAKRRAPGRKDPTVVDDPTLEDNRGFKCQNSASPEPLKAIPRVIDFDQMPSSTAIPSQNFPSLRLLTPLRREAPYKPPDDSGSENAVLSGQELFDPPTPEKPIAPNLGAQNQNVAELDVDDDPIGNGRQHENHTAAGASEKELYDKPTPAPRPDPSSPQKDSLPGSILPASLPTPVPTSFSPVRSAPLNVSNIQNVSISCLSDDSEQHPTLSPSKSKPSPKKPCPQNSKKSFETPCLPSAKKPQSPLSPPLNTQLMLDKANESFDAVVSPLTPASLLPPVCLQPRKPSPKFTFTPFRDLNQSPPGQEEVSFRLLSAQESPLTYSPRFKEDALWNEVKGYLTSWDLDQEVRKHKDEVGLIQDKAGRTGEEKSASQDCVVGA